MVVKNERVVAFVKGTRTQPQCGFSHQMLTLLNAARVDYQVCNVLDDVYNPGAQWLKDSTSAVTGLVRARCALARCFLEWHMEMAR